MPRAPKLVETRPTGHGRARGLVSSRASGRRTQGRTFEPPADLRDVIEAFWTGRWELRGESPHVTELLSDPCVHFSFESGDSTPGGRVVGVWTRLWRRKLTGNGCVRGVKLRAGALRAFVDVPAFRFANRIVPLGEVCGERGLALERTILGTDDDDEAFGALEAWLRAERREPPPELELAVAVARRIAQEGSIRSVEELSRATGLGPRALQRLFRDHVGASPKWVIRRHRLQEVALRLERGDPVTLAALAADLGYTDQAHLARDFKSAVGKPPSDFALSVHR
jgi:AraC-like DNA-binding protein